MEAMGGEPAVSSRDTAHSRLSEPLVKAFGQENISSTQTQMPQATFDLKCSQRSLIHRIIMWFFIGF